MKFKINFSFTQYILLILLTSVIFRFYNINFSDYWGDEQNTFYVSDPFVSFSETINRIYSMENTNLYYFLLKKIFNIFGYVPEYGRYTTATIGSLVPVITFITFYKKIDNNLLLICCLVISSNIYLIDQSQEVRAQTYICATFLLCVFSSLKYLETDKFIYGIFFIIFSVTSSMLHIFGSLIFVSLIIYSLFLSKKKFYKLCLLSLFSLVIFLIINFEFLKKLYLIEQIAYAKPKLSFFYDYYFTYFFGSYFVGKILLFTYMFLLVFNFKHILLKKNHILFITIIIISAYLFPLIYTFIRKPTMMPRSIIFVVPLIIYSLFYFYSISNFGKKNFIMIFLIVITLSNTIYSIRNLKTQNLTRIKNFLSNNNVNNTNIFIISNDIKKINYYMNIRNLKSKNINMINEKNLNNIPKNSYVIIDSNQFNKIASIYEILYADPWSTIIEK